MSSVKLLKELNKIQEDRNYFFDKKEDVLCRIMKTTPLMVLKMKKPKELAALVKVDKMLRGHDLKLTRADVFNFMMALNDEDLPYSSRLLIDLGAGNVVQVHEALKWRKIIEPKIKEREGLEDLSNRMIKVVADDGLNEVEFIAEDIDMLKNVNRDVYVSLVDNNEYTSDNGYIVANQTGDIKYKLSSIRSANK